MPAHDETKADARLGVWQRLAAKLGVNVAIAHGHGKRVSVNNKGPVTQGDNQPITIGPRK